MCDAYAYKKDHVPMPGDTRSGGDIPMPCMSYKEAPLSLVQTINFIDNWLQCFEVNYYNRITIYKRKMSELFKKISKSLPKK